jgi:hypothetical protein
VDLPHGLQLGELGEGERDRLLNTAIGILLDSPGNCCVPQPVQ